MMNYWEPYGTIPRIKIKPKKMGGFWNLALSAKGLPASTYK
jgi:hypothetical protein